MLQPPSIKLFGLLSGLSAMIALGVALDTATSMTFGFRIAPDAAATLAERILAIRVFGFLFAASLIFLVVFGRSRAARGALGLRWLMGVATSVPFLRGIGIVVPLGSNSAVIMALALVQLAIEGFAILILYGEDASEWFERRRYG